MAVAMRVSRLMECCMRSEDFVLLFGDRSQLLAEDQPAITVDGGQRCAKIVNRARQKIGAILVVFLQLQIRVQKTLQDLVAVGPQRIHFRRSDSIS